MESNRNEVKVYNIDKYIKELNAINKKCLEVDINKRSETWKKEVIQFVQVIFDEICQKYDLYEKVDHKISFCICGSLAKAQATPYSDLDCFVITDSEATTNLYKKPLEDFYDIFNKIFEATHQLSLDPIGINPQKFCGTPDKLAKRINEGEIAFKDAFYDSIVASTALYGDDLLKELKQKITPPNDKIELIKRYYTVATQEYCGTKSKEVVNLKADLFRTLDFILAALRVEADIKHADGSHLVTLKLIEELKVKKKISEDVYLIIKDVFENAMALRFTQHVKEKSEEDVVPLDNKKIRILVDKVALIRGIASKRLESITSGTPIDELPTFAIENFLNPEYADRTFNKDEMLLDLGVVATVIAINGENVEFSRIATTMNAKNELDEKVKTLENITRGILFEELKSNISKFLLWLKEQEITQKDIPDFKGYVESILNIVTTDINAIQTRDKFNEYITYVKNYQMLKNKITQNYPAMPNSDLVINQITLQIHENLFRNEIFNNQDYKQQIDKIKTRCTDNNVSTHIQIALQLIDHKQQRPAIKILQDNVDYKNVELLAEPGLLNVVTAINSLENYLHRKTFFHSKKTTVRNIIHQAESILANHGPNEATKFLYSEYSKAIKLDRDSKLTETLSDALRLALNIKPQNNSVKLDVLDNHINIMNHVQHVTRFIERLTKYKSERESSFAFKFTFRAKSIERNKKEIESLDLLLGEAQDKNKISDLNFDLSNDAWNYLNESPIVQNDIKSLLIRQCKGLYRRFCDMENALPNHKTAISELDQKLSHLLNMTSADSVMLTNQQIALLARALKLTHKILSAKDPTNCNEQKALAKLVKEMKKSPYLKNICKTFIVFTNHEIRKEMVLDKIEKKIKKIRNPFLSTYASKYSKLIELKEAIKSAPVDKKLGETIEGWETVENKITKNNLILKDKDGLDVTFTNAKLIDRQRNIFLSPDRKEPQTETRKLIEKLKTKYGNTVLRSK